MTAQPQTTPAHRVAAVLALLGGASALQICTGFGISRSTLYAWRRRALDAVETTLTDRPYGPKTPHNRLSAETEREIALLCRRYPTWSSAKIHRYMGEEAPSLSTVARVRRRLNLQRLPVRLPARYPAKRIDNESKTAAWRMIENKPWLGPERISWELRNTRDINISPATIKRMKRVLYLEKHPLPAPPNWCFYERHHPHSLWHGDCMEKVSLTGTGQRAYHLVLQDDYSRGYIFCDLFPQMDVRTTVEALITAIRQWQVIPKTVIFDNGAPFRGRLISAFCQAAGIQLTYTAVQHPQTNGKLERAFRDDMREFYRQYDVWELETLRRNLPDYVYYRNNVRGHTALNGQPAITRLQEQNRMVIPWVLDQLEGYACYHMDDKKVDDKGCVRFFNKNIYLDIALAGQRVPCYETLYGIEIPGRGSTVYSMPGYRQWMKIYPILKGKLLPPDIGFQIEQNPICPALADSLRQ